MANNYHKLAVPIPCGLVNRNSGAEKGGPDQGATVPEPDTHTKQPVLFRTTKHFPKKISISTLLKQIHKSFSYFLDISNIHELVLHVFKHKLH